MVRTKSLCSRQVYRGKSIALTGRMKDVTSAETAPTKVNELEGKLERKSKGKGLVIVTSKDISKEKEWMILVLVQKFKWMEQG